jgi:hypothetical protein
MNIFPRGKSNAIALPDLSKTIDLHQILNCFLCWNNYVLPALAYPFEAEQFWDKFDLLKQRKELRYG